MDGIPEQIFDGDWMAFPGGELEGRRPKALCPQCRERVRQRAAGSERRTGAPTAGRVPPPLCFQCYRAQMIRERALRVAGAFDVSSLERFQSQLPLEPVNRPRLEMLKVERSAARAARRGTQAYEPRLRRAQIAARHALQQVVAGLAVRKVGPPARAREIAAAIHAAELQLPEAWLPFVVSR